MVYVLDDEHRTEILDDLKIKLAKIEGVQKVLGEEEYTALGLPTPQADRRAPDLWLAAESGYSFTNTDSGDDTVVARTSIGGTHGYLPDQPDMLGTLVMSGYGIKPGVELGKVSNMDVAPTIARLLGVELPTADGKPLDGALTAE